MLGSVSPIQKSPDALLVELETLRLQVCRNLQLLLPFVGPADFQQRLSESVMGRGHLVVVVSERGIKRDGFLKRFDRLCMFAGALVCLTEMKIRIGIMRLFAHGFLEQRDRRLKLPFHE